jgi:predicted PurR-regulated permease PerM
MAERPADHGSSLSEGESLTAPAGGTLTPVPSWLENVAALSWRIVVVVAFAVVAWYLGQLVWTVTASIAVAIVVSAVFAPYVLRLRDAGRSRNAAAGIVWAVAILVIGAIVLLLVLAFLPYVADLVARLSAGQQKLATGVADLPLPEWVARLAADVVAASESVGGEAISEIVGSAASTATILLLAAFLVFFFLRDGDKAWLWLFQGLGDEKRERITSAGDAALWRVGGYLRGTTVLAGIIAVTNYAVMLLLGVPLALPLAVLSFVATYIPYFGGIATTILILLVTYGAVGTGAAITVLVLLTIRGGAVSYFVRPLVYERTVHLHPALVLVVLPAGLQLGGLVGLFAAVPVTAVILTVAQAAKAIMQPDPAPKLPELVPAWLDRAAQWSWRLLLAAALAAVLIGILTTIPLVIVPIILALVLAATLQPLVHAIVQRGHSRGAATVMAVGGTTLAIVAILALALVSLVDQAVALGETVLAGAGSINDSADGHLQIGQDALAAGVSGTVEMIRSWSSSLAALGTIVLLSVLLAFYFLRDGAGLRDRVLSRAQGDVARQLTAAGERAFEVLGGYMIGTAAISFVGAASQLVIMVVLGLPLALPVFVLSFFGGFIPYIGSLLTTGVAFLIAVAVGEPIDILVMAIWTLVFNLVQGNIVGPLVYGRTTHIHPAIVLVAIPAGAAIAGIPGMFIAVPAIGVVATTWRTLLSLMGTEHPSRPTADDSPDPDVDTTVLGEPAPASDPSSDVVVPEGT